MSIIVNLINGLNFTIDYSNINLVSNLTVSMNETLTDILNLTNMSYEEINFIKYMQICWMKQYESVAEYRQYCKIWNPFNPFDADSVKTTKEVEMNLTVSLLNESVANQEREAVDVSSCFNMNKYTNILVNGTDYLIINMLWAGSSYLLDESICWMKIGLYTIGVLKA